MDSGAQRSPRMSYGQAVQTRGFATASRPDPPTTHHVEGAARTYEWYTYDGIGRLAGRGPEHLLQMTAIYIRMVHVTVIRGVSCNIGYRTVCCEITAKSKSFVLFTKFP